MEQKNCPDPRNCVKIHFFGKCPYKHQPCNRGTSCSYVTQNNCQFYHPEEDYPQCKPKKTAFKKEKKKPSMTPVKIVKKPTAAQLASIASKTFAEMSALQKDRKPPVKIGADPKVSKEELTSTKPANKAKSTGELIRKTNDPSKLDYLKGKMKEQEEYIRDLEARILTAKENAELHRRRAQGMESDGRKFYTCWSRAVKTLERIKDTATFLDERLSRAIEYESASLRSCGSSGPIGEIKKNYGQKHQENTFFSLNPIEERSKQYSYQQQELNCIPWQDPGVPERSLGYKLEGASTVPPFMSQTVPGVLRGGLDSLVQQPDSGQSIFSEDLLSSLEL